MINGTRHRLNAEIARQTMLAREIARAQTDISSGKRLQTASDDPAASARVADIRRTQANEAVWASNVEAGSALATRADSTLSGVATALDRAKELMLAASSGTYSASNRVAIAVELRGIAVDIDAASRLTDSRGQALFPDGPALSIPIGPGLFVSPSAARTEIFGDIATAAGPKDMISIINGAADAIELEDEQARKAAGTAALDEIDAASERMAIARGDQGVRAGRLDNARERFAASGLVLDEERGRLEGTDISKTVARLQAKLLTLEASQTTFARVNRQTLFDLLG